MTIEVIRVPPDMVGDYLAMGWRLPAGAHVGHGHDGVYNVRMWRLG